MRAGVKFSRWFLSKMIKRIFASTDKHKSVHNINKNWKSFNYSFGYQRIYDGYEPKDMILALKSVEETLEDESHEDCSDN